MNIAIVQHPPAYLDLQSSLQKATSLIEEAAALGADLVVFGETWLSGYPAWLDHCPEVALWGNPATKEVFARMHQSSICIPGSETKTFAKLAQVHQLTLVIGVNERVDQGPGSGTIYNSLLSFSPDGILANHHRKLMPTYTEKLLYGQGDGHGLQTIGLEWGRLGDSYAGNIGCRMPGWPSMRRESMCMWLFGRQFIICISWPANIMQ